MKNQPLVSIISSSYNHAEFVEEFVESVFQQNYPNTELIMMDDGSKDGCDKVVGKLSEKYGFYCLLRENGGFPNALNTLLPKAKGKYIVIIAADDKMPINRIKKQVEFLEKNPELAITCGFMQEIDEKSTLGNFVKNPFKSGDIWDKLFLSETYILAPTVMIRKECLDQVGKYDENLKVEDFDMWLRLGKKFPLGYQDELFAYYRKHSGNSHGNYKSSYEQKELVLQKWKDHPLFPSAMEKFEKGGFTYLSGLKNFKPLAKEFMIRCKKYGVFNPFFIKNWIKYTFKKQ
jgi:alpha-1,3-rhamnosyltransferase